MVSLDKFNEMDMIEQIEMLEDLKEQHQFEALSTLLNIYSAAKCDQAVDEMLYHTIFELLDGREGDIIAGMEKWDRRIRQLCIRKAADSTPPQAKKRLVQELDEGEDEEMVSEIIRALSYYKDPELAPLFKKYLTHDDPTIVSWAENGLEFIKKGKETI